MRPFDEFRDYLASDGGKVFEEISVQFESTLDNKQIDNLMTADHAYTQIAIMKILEKYHEWLSDKC